jgi:hypothetical protein
MIPHSAILAYVQWLREDELIVDWAQSQAIERLEIRPHSERYGGASPETGARRKCELFQELVEKIERRRKNDQS